jgi:hypothetical protein
VEPGPQPKKKTSTLTIVLVLVGSAFLVGLVGLGVIGFLVWRNPEGRKFVGVMGDTYRMMQKAQKAPGTKELRALGCQQAMVMDTDDFVQIARRLDAGPTVPPVIGAIVVCAAKPWGTPPSCDDAAKTYLSGAGPRDRSFVVSVTQSGKSKPVCQALYDKSGARQDDFDQDLGVEPPPAD